MNAPLFSIIIPVYNKWELTANCLHSLREHTVEGTFEVIVIDNASSDATATELAPLGEALFPGAFTALCSPENLNFGPASNLGARHAQADLLFFLNNDTQVTPGWSDPLLAALRERPELGAVGPLLLYPDQRVQHLGVTFAPQGCFHLYSMFPQDHPVVRRTRRLQAITAAALMMPARIFHQCGGFYEGYKNGFEDVDLSLRIRQQGHTLACIAQSVVYHLESQSPGRNNAERKNALLLQERCGKDLFLDLHRHALRDGFALRIDGACGLRALVPPQQSAELLAQIRGKDEDTLAATVAAHPLWLEGHILFAERLMAQKRYKQGCDVWFHTARIFPSLSTSHALAEAARQAGDQALLNYTEKVAATMLELQENTEAALERVRNVLRRVRRENDNYLADLYQKELEALKRKKATTAEPASAPHSHKE